MLTYHLSVSTSDTDNTFNTGWKFPSGNFPIHYFLEGMLFKHIIGSIFECFPIVFYTNFNSTKGCELKGNQKASMCFHWKSLRRQVRVLGNVEEVSPEEAIVL